MTVSEKQAEIKGALKLIARLLKNEQPTSFGAYRLRHARYNLFKSRGLAARMTYPKAENDQGLPCYSVSPVLIRRHQRFNQGV